MFNAWYGLICVLVLKTNISAKDIGGRKLVCSQPDGTIEGPKGYCIRIKSSCSCTNDCKKNLSMTNCICTRADLNFAKKERLGNCSIWTHQAWTAYVKSSRQNSTNIDLPPSPSNTPDGKNILFSTNNQGLPWPVTDPRDFGILLIHGPHCLKMIKMYNKQIKNGQPLRNIHDRLHSEHCRRLARRVLNYYQNEEKNYRVRPTSLCHDFHTAYYRTDQQSAHDHTHTQDEDKYEGKSERRVIEDLPLEQSDDEGIGYDFDYSRRAVDDKPLDEKTNDDGLDYKIRYKRQTSDVPIEEEVEDDGGISYGLNYKRQAEQDIPPNKRRKGTGLSYKSRNLHKLLHKAGASGYGDSGLAYPFEYKRSLEHHKNQSDTISESQSIYNQIYNKAKKEDSKEPSQRRILDTLSGQNLGTILVKEWLELPLTNAERHFLAGWESELVVRTAAIGIYCIQGEAKYAPTTEIRNLLLMNSK